MSAPEFKCTQCGAHYYGWSKQETCPTCGGKLVEITKGLVKPA